MNQFPAIVYHINDEVAVAIGYVAPGAEECIYTCPEECQARNEGATPMAGFVILNKKTMDIADAIPTWHPTFQDAINAYEENMRKPVVKELATYDLDASKLRILQITSPVKTTIGIAVSLTFPDGGVQDVATVSVNPDGRFADVFVWENEEDEAFTFSARTLIRQPKKQQNETESEPIINFRGEYRFLRNSYPVRFEYGGLAFTNAEAAFQSEKCKNDDRIAFCGLSAKDARTIGRNINLRSNWKLMRRDIMENVLRAKFDWTNGLAEKLIETGDREIRPENVRHENYWGTCRCPECAGKKGQNHLGKILMKIRDELKEDE